MADRRASLLRPAFTGGLVSGVLVVSALGCGGDEEAKRPREPPARGETTGSGPTAPVPTATAPSATAPPSSEARPRPGKSRREDPESVTGGVGDEEAARAPAMFTGRGGRITPRVVRVPPFLGIAVEVRSADGRDYAVGFGRVIARSGRRGRGISQLAGLRPGRRLVGRPAGGGPSVAIEASAEPGP